ncbi:MAG: WG repeat-containing protein [Defluviitaleaceae bacterium]|nr:WG repeat-containing protein [Defluviitaleaceae bacterium]
MTNKTKYISIIIAAAVITVATGLIVFSTLRDNKQGEIPYIPVEEASPTPPALYEEDEVEEAEATPEPYYPDDEDYPLDEEEDEPERILPELTEGPIRWHTKPTWAFDQVFPFNEGMAAVEIFELSDYHWDFMHILGYMNNIGEIIIPIEHIHYPELYMYRGAPPFSEGRVAVMSVENGGIGVFDTDGNLIVPFYFQWGWTFSEGLMAVRQGGWEFINDQWVDNSRWGFIDRDGNIAIPMEFDYAVNFRGGFAPVMRDGYWGFINTSGEVVIPFIIEVIFNEIGYSIYPRFSEGMVAISTTVIEQNENEEWVYVNRWGFMDMEGNMTIPFQFKWVLDIYNDLAIVAMGGWQDWGLIDCEGNVVLPFEYNWIEIRESGLVYASHREDGHRVYDREGNQIEHPERYESFANLLPLVSFGSGFYEGFAVVQMGGWEDSLDGSRVDNTRWGYADYERNIVVPIVFDEVRSFSEGLAWVRFGNYWGLIQIIDY